MYDLINHTTPEDVVFATGETHSVREFCKLAFDRADLGDYNKYVKIDPRLYRAADWELNS